MSWSLKIARIAGTELRIHITFVLFLAWIAFIYYQMGGGEAVVQGLVFVLALFLCVVLHEFGHVTAARAFGVPTPDITLLPIGGVARLQRMPDKPREEVIVALAGPAVNVVIAAVLYFGTGLPPRFADATLALDPDVTLAARLLAVNVLLVVFNLIPAFPMDGGRVLRALLAMALPYGRATRIAATVGQGFAFLFGFLGLFGNPVLLFIALFIYIAASQEAAFASLRDLSTSLSVTDAMITDVTSLPRDATIGDAAEALIRTSQHDFPLVDESGRLTGILTRDAMIAALKQDGPSAPAAQAMRTNVPAVHRDASFDEAFKRMQECNCPALPVIDSAGRLVGMITPENVGELMMIKSAIGEKFQPTWRRAAA